LVPAYFYPGGPGLDFWNRLIQAGSRVPIIAIANPASGPGAEANADYARIIAQAVGGKVTVVGYVNTDYTSRPAAEVKADIDRWIEFYPEIQGIFLDMQASGPEQVDYYRSIAAYIRSKLPGPTKLVVGNPGTFCDPGYFEEGVADLVCIFEMEKGFDTLELPPPLRRVDPAKIAVLPYNIVGVPAMDTAIREAAGRGIGCIYASDARKVAEWDRLPSYWVEEIDAVERFNRGSP
jgi:hypothetical protein